MRHSTTRKLLFFLTLPLLGATAPRGCVGSMPLGSFELLVDPGTGAPPKPIRQVNAILPGYKLLYKPVQLPAQFNKTAEIALVLGPDTKGGTQPADLAVLEHHAAGKAAEWKVKIPVAVVGLVFGPQGLDQKRVSSLVKKDEELIAQLADYAEQTSKVETLIDTLAAVDQDPSAGKNLDAALSGFASRSGIAVPKLDRNAPTNEQAMALMKSLNPALSAYDPLAPQPSMRMQQSAGLAASVAGLFLGNTVGLAAGGALLVQNLRTMMFPDTAFRSALMQSSANDGLTLCAKRQTAKSRTRIAYLWAVRVPNAPKPVLAVAGPAHLPVGLKSPLQVKAGDVGQWKYLDRARDWRLVSTQDGRTYPLAVTPRAEASALTLDLGKAPAGTYQLAAAWDWEPVEVQGKVEVAPLGDLKAAKIDAASEDRLVEGSGVVRARLAGADFQFIEKIALRGLDQVRSAPVDLAFTLPAGPRGGKQEAMEVEVDTGKLKAGRYALLLTQSGGKPHEMALRILPPHPKLAGLPLLANLGEKSQTLRLRGSGLERIQQIKAEKVEVTLRPQSGKEAREAGVRLLEGAAKGDRIDFELRVEGLHEPLRVPGALEVIGPRPKIQSVKASLPDELSVSLRESELPAGSFVSFAMQVERLASEPAVQLRCDASGNPAAGLTLRPGEKRAGARLELAGQGLLFVSFDPGSIGQAGCAVTATVETRPEGASEPHSLGRVVRLPRIESFLLTEEKLGADVYAGILKGQDLETIEKTGWNAATGLAVRDLPKPVAGQAPPQSLRVALPWPAPAPHAPLYVWLRGESLGRATKARY